MFNNNFSAQGGSASSGKISFLLIGAVILTLGLSISLQSILADWTAPSANPPICASGNSGCDAPLNVGSSLQTKTGPLWVNTGGISPLGLIVEKGNVGIGTVDPTGQLHIKGVTGNGVIRIQKAAENFTTAISLMNSTVDKWSIAIHPNEDKLRFAADGDTTNKTRMTIDNAGNVGIGTVNPGQKLDVNGNVQATAFLYSSDKNLKDNIKILPDSLDKISQLNGVSFSWRDNNQASIGLIAQDVEKIFPELVTTSSDTGLKSINYAGLIAPLIEAVKEQQAEIENLKERLRLLEK